MPHITSKLVLLFFVGLLAINGCYHPPDFTSKNIAVGETEEETDSGTIPETGSYTPTTPTLDPNSLDLPLPAGFAAPCIYGPEIGTTADVSATFDLFFEITPAVYREYELQAVEILSPGYGYISTGWDARLGNYVSIGFDDRDHFLVVGGFDGLAVWDGTPVGQADLLGWATFHGDRSSLITVGEHAGARQEPVSHSISLPSIFRTRDLTWGTTEVSLASDDFICGPDGHAYQSLNDW